jgi:hypothetical protein
VYGQGDEPQLSETSNTNPISVYAKSTLEAEQQNLSIADKDFCVVALRNATLFGLSQRMRFDLVVNLMTLSAFQKGRIIVMGGGLQWRPLVHLSDVSKAFQDPIKSVCILTDFAKKRMNKHFGNKTLTKVHPKLEIQGNHFVSSLKDFSIAVENTIMKFGKNIIGNELLQMRIANMAIELYVQICVLSRTTAILFKTSVTEADKEYVTLLTELIMRDSRQNFTRNYKRLNSSYDKLIPKISKAVSERDGFGFDIIDF